MCIRDRYKYHPIVVTLTEEELEAYDNLSYEIGKCIMKDKNGKIKLSSKMCIRDRGRGI